MPAATHQTVFWNGRMPCTARDKALHLASIVERQMTLCSQLVQMTGQLETQSQSQHDSSCRMDQFCPHAAEDWQSQHWHKHQHQKSQKVTASDLHWLHLWGIDQHAQGPTHETAAIRAIHGLIPCWIIGHIGLGGKEQGMHGFNHVVFWGHFLRVHVKCNCKDRSIKLMQPGLAKCIVEALNILHLQQKFNPTATMSSVQDKGRDPPDGACSCLSIIGMLQHLQNQLHLDLAHVVSQVPHFTHDLKWFQDLALEHVRQCLKGVIDEGPTLWPSGSFDINICVDTDFAGLQLHEDKTDLSCLKSCAGFVICVSNCPVILTSLLQRIICLLTMEAKCKTLSLAMCSTLPFQKTVWCIAAGIQLLTDQVTSFKMMVCEDNVGTLTLTSLELGQITPHSKHCVQPRHAQKEIRT